MQLSVSKNLAHVEDPLATLSTETFYRSLVEHGALEKVEVVEDGLRVFASTNLPKLILKLFPKAPASVSWVVGFSQEDDKLLVDTVPDVPDSWREHFSIDRFIELNGNTITETIELELELPKKWKRLVGIVESRLETYIHTRLDLLSAGHGENAA